MTLNTLSAYIKLVIGRGFARMVRGLWIKGTVAMMRYMSLLNVIAICSVPRFKRKKVTDKVTFKFIILIIWY